MIGKLSEEATLCTIDAVGLYPNIPHGEGLASLSLSLSLSSIYLSIYLSKFLETRENKQISNYVLAELAEIVLKNNIFEFDEKTFKQKRGTVI